MPLIRVNALRSVLRQSGARATTRTTGPARTQLVARRFASSGGHGHGEPAGNELVTWGLPAAIVTAASTWYLWPDTTHAEHHGDHGHGEEEHAEEGGEEEEKSGEEEKSSEEDQSEEDQAPQKASTPGEQAGEEGAAEKGVEKGETEKSDSEKGDSEKSDSRKGGEADTSEDQEKAKESEESAKPSGSQGEAQPNPAKSDAQDSTEEKPGSAEKLEKGETTEGVQFKGKMKEDSAGLADERKSEPVPSKGSRTKRIDSGLGKKLGQGDTYDEEGKDNQAQSKEVSSDAGDISNKQKGISTTDAKHSYQVDQDPSKSKKGSGGVETAKAKGTIDPNAPVR